CDTRSAAMSTDGAVHCQRRYRWATPVTLPSICVPPSSIFSVVGPVCRAGGGSHLSAVSCPPRSHHTSDRRVRTASLDPCMEHDSVCAEVAAVHTHWAFL